MEENILENDTLTNEQDIYGSDAIEETTAPKSVEKPPEVDKEVLTLKAQKEHFREKSEKLEAKLKELESKIPTTSPKDNYDPIKVVKLAQAVKDLSAEELEFVTKFAKTSSPEDLLEAANNEWVKTAISAQREKAEKTKQIPSPSSPSFATEPSIEEGLKIAKDSSVSDKDLDEITRKAFEENLAKQGKKGTRI